MRFVRAVAVAGCLLVSMAPIGARGATINPLTAVFSGFTTNPTAFNNVFGLEGPDGVLGTVDDLPPRGTGATPVPEASNWVTLLSGIGLVMGLKAWKARRSKRRQQAGVLRAAGPGGVG